MHFCGNIFHDAPLYLALAFPFIAPAILWLRHKFRLFEKHKHHG